MYLAQFLFTLWNVHNGHSTTADNVADNVPFHIVLKQPTENGKNVEQQSFRTAQTWSYKVTYIIEMNLFYLELKMLFIGCFEHILNLLFIGFEYLSSSFNCSCS